MVTGTADTMDATGAASVALDATLGAGSSSSSPLLDDVDEGSGSGSGSGSVKRSFRLGPRLDGGDENDRS